jgi:hypothetical protein
MFIVMTRVSRADAPDWPGRKGLAAIDAVVWPILWIFLFRHLPTHIGLVGSVGCAAAVLCAITRLQRALLMNHRYWFTTWRWGKVVGAMLLMGWVMKLTTSG